ncbi:MAG: RNA polymerase factor sigma-54 [Nevskia sp.]
MTQSAYSLGTKQQLSASPRLQQAVRLLQMSALEFEQELQQQLASNPFLEECEPDSEDGRHDEDGASPDPAGEPVEPFESAVLTGERDGADAFDAAAGEPVVSDTQEWADLPETAFEAVPAGGSGDPEADPYARVATTTSLREHLHAQVDGARCEARQRLAAQLVIETLDDDGYLRDDVHETAAALQLAEPLTAADIEAGIGLVQQFDPAGVAARDLSECLVLQLQALPGRTPGHRLALSLVRSHLDLLAKRDYGALQRRLDCSRPALLQAHVLIRRLDPRPGSRHGAARTDYIVPDVIVLPQKSRLRVVINPAVMPRARLNSGCIELLRRSRNGLHPAMQNQLEEARWLMRNAEQRHVTIRRVAEAIVARQRAFFEYGEIALKPLILREIADELGLHESTLSRATGNKYMATPRGVFEFRHFFSRQLKTGTGGTCSASSVRALIREMIETESRDAPLSDVSLAKLLGGQGICVARRTVAKYRNQLRMRPAELRYLP